MRHAPRALHPVLAADPHPRPGPSRRAARVMVVEDDSTVREAIAELLQYEGYAVDVAANGMEALVALRTTPLPDVIVLDLAMPVMNGWAFRQEQLRDPALAGIPVVVASASDLGDVQPDVHLRKPFAPDDLVSAVEALTGERARAAH